MKILLRILFLVYQWLIAFPVLIVLTILTAFSTILFSPLFPNNQISYFPARWWARLICYLLLVRVKVRGLEHIDSNQSYVIACNHQSMFDVYVIYGWLPVIFKWIMKAELRKIPAVGRACHAAGHIFINRSNPVAAKKSLEHAESQLKNGVSVVIFPEGTRSSNGQMGPFKRGAFRIATDLHLPIIPITIKGSFERMSRKAMNVTPGVIEVIIHQPISTVEYTTETSAPLVEQTWQQINSALK